MNIIEKLKEMNIELPKPAAPLAAYVPVVVSDGAAYVSGQLPVKDGKVVYSGIFGNNISVEDGQKAAELCAINILAALSGALGGDLGRVGRLIKISGFCAASPDFKDHPKVINGASEFFKKVMGDNGAHARAALGVSSLPLGAAVEIEAIFKIN
ncbi:MAG TPA: RidA family protein [Candidatus Wallbacteria bacterium]|nr:RidA family protein [Candidatus Wallbacteria bacterium]